MRQSNIRRDPRCEIAMGVGNGAIIYECVRWNVRVSIGIEQIGEAPVNNSMSRGARVGAEERLKNIIINCINWKGPLR